ncbi:competence protein ComG [Bacillus sp. FJAT-27225]|uniref:competence type IV pilus major pilin ComGC n=1 Tax=Bacillus sp. FJAT-27225 TaxID=1743144 RepID=UPI00080C31F7|nr:competence type IV pilus major pilin ComGC [Bacillus sp. FJAT-27225]OCA91095.1 competence protein ComG [Bacillus sp. FJAT-27225]
MKKIKNENGFTLIEMMIVMLVISVLLAITIPNLTSRNEAINKKGCGALVKVVEAQVQAYQLERGAYPQDLNTLIQAKYLNPEAGVCPGGKKQIIVNSDGTVSEVAISTVQ